MCIRDSITCIRPEYTYGNSRFDLYVEAGERKIFIEVKGVTLEEDGVVRFPDAPSERAVKHVEELQKAVKDGYEAYVFFVIQMKDVRYFTPNRQTHPAFAEALAEAERNGVKILAYDCSVTEDSIELGKEVPVVLEYPQRDEMRESDVYKRQVQKHVVKASGVVAGGIDGYNANSYYAFCDLETLKQLLKKEFSGRAIPGLSLIHI